MFEDEKFILNWEEAKLLLRYANVGLMHEVKYSGGMNALEKNPDRFPRVSCDYEMIKDIKARFKLDERIAQERKAEHDKKIQEEQEKKDKVIIQLIEVSKKYARVHHSEFTELVENPGISVNYGKLVNELIEQGKIKGKYMKNTSTFLFERS